MELVFVTGNKRKFEEAREILGDVGIDIAWKNIDLKEIQADSLEEIAKEKAIDAYEKLREPCFVEDAGLFVKALNNFPGQYSKFVLNTIGYEGIIKLMKNEMDRTAEFRAVIAFTDGKEVKTFKGVVKGKIALKPSGESGFGFDPIFIPNGYEKTFADDPVTKNRISHRRNALLAFKEWLISNK